MPRRGPTDETWLSNQRDIALYLSPADFTLVAVPYQLLPVLRTMVRKSHEEEHIWPAADFHDALAGLPGCTASRPLFRSDERVWIACAVDARPRGRRKVHDASFRDGIALLEAREEGRRSLPFRR